MANGVRVAGLDNVIGVLKKAPAELQKYGKVARDKALDALRQRAETYPRKRVGQLYKRTGTLGRGWAEKRDSDFGGSVYNAVKYAPYVQGTPGTDNPSQAWMHKGRWASTQMIATEQQQKIIGFYDYAVQQVVKKLG